MVETADFEGQEYVHANVEYPKLPSCIRVETDRWPKRLASIGISFMLPDCRSCKFGDIMTEETRNVRKSVYVLKSLWDARVRRAIDETGVKANPEQQSKDSEESGVGDLDQQTQHTALNMDEIHLNENEAFYFNKQKMLIKAYGERSHEKLFLDLKDVAMALGFKATDLPASIEESVVVLKVDNVCTQALPFFSFMHLTFIKKHKYPVAAAIADWITSTIFTVQFTKGQCTIQQRFFADRTADFQSRNYGMHGEMREGLYVDEICSAWHAAQLFPEQIAAAIPHGRNISEFTLCSPGESKDFRRRTYEHRTDFAKLFPGSDVRPVDFVDMPQSTTKERKDAEKIAFSDEFQHLRVHGIHFNKRELIELYLFDDNTRRSAAVNMQLEARNYCKARVENATLLVEEAQRELHRRDLIEQRLELEKARACDLSMNLKTMLEQTQQANNDLVREVKSLKDSLSQLLPKKMAGVLKGVLCGS